MSSNVNNDLWAISSIALYSTGHWIGGTVCLVAYLLVVLS